MDDPDTGPAAEQYDWAGIHDICPTCGAGPWGLAGAISGKGPRYGFPPAHTGTNIANEPAPRWWCYNCEYGPEKRFWKFNPDTGRLNNVTVTKSN